MTRDEQIQIRTGLQIIVGALATGVAIFLAVVWYLWNQGAPREPAESTPLLSNISAVMLLVSLVARLVVRKVMSTMENGERMFVVAGAAMIEFAGLFACTAYLIEGTNLAFGVALVSIPLILALQFPSEARWEQWSKASRVVGEFDPDTFET